MGQSPGAKGCQYRARNCYFKHIEPAYYYAHNPQPRNRVLAYIVSAGDVGKSTASSRLRKSAGTSSFRGAGVTRELGIQEHSREKSMHWPVFIGSGPGPDGPSRNDTRVFQHPAS